MQKMKNRMGVFFFGLASVLIVVHLWTQLSIFKFQESRQGTFFQITLESEPSGNESSESINYQDLLETLPDSTLW